MSSRHTNPAEDPDSEADATPPTDGIYDDVALREAIARLMADSTDELPLDDTARRARVEALRDKIQGGDYMSDEKISDVVDRLMRKWKF